MLVSPFLRRARAVMERIHLQWRVGDAVVDAVAALEQLLLLHLLRLGSGSILLVRRRVLGRCWQAGKAYERSSRDSTRKCGNPDVHERASSVEKYRKNKYPNYYP
jgi:hypothetical protein